MKRFPALIACPLLLAMVSGCATPYLASRGRDALDIVTLTAGLGAGANVKAGPIKTGLFMGVDFFGVRNGVAFTPNHYAGVAWGEFDSLVMPIREDQCGDTRWIFGNSAIINVGNQYDTRGYPEYAETIFPCISIPRYIEKAKRPTNPLKYYTQIEVAGGLLGVLRVGFNPGELIDFILGWTTIDIFADDLKRKTPKDETNKVSGVSSYICTFTPPFPCNTSGKHLVFTCADPKPPGAVTGAVTGCAVTGSDHRL